MISKVKSLRRADLLLSQFVKRFSASDPCDQDWFVKRQDTCELALVNLYGKLPAKFPLLYERLLLTYRWQSSLVGGVDLFANPAGRNFDAFRCELFRDGALSEVCLPQGYLQFGSGPHGTYDPVCFDTAHRSQRGDFPVVQLDHEAILCKNKIKVVQVLSASFEDMVLNAVRDSLTA